MKFFYFRNKKIIFLNNKKERNMYRNLASYTKTRCSIYLGINMG